MSRVRVVGKQGGFTLLEVLLAGFILFLVLSSMTMVYRGAMLSSGKAERALKLTSSIMPIKQIIAQQLHAGDGEKKLAGDGRYGHLNYTWTGTVTHQGYYRVQDDPQASINYYLTKIDMRVTDGDAAREYAFSELTW